MLLFGGSNPQVLAWRQSINSVGGGVSPTHIAGTALHALSLSRLRAVCCLLSRSIFFGLLLLLLLLLLLFLMMLLLLLLLAAAVAAAARCSMVCFFVYFAVSQSLSHMYCRYCIACLVPALLACCLLFAFAFNLLLLLFFVVFYFCFTVCVVR